MLVAFYYILLMKVTEKKVFFHSFPYLCVEWMGEMDVEGDTNKYEV